MIHQTLPPLLVCTGRDVICLALFAHIIVFSSEQEDYPES